MNNRTIKSRGGRRGFTIVELLIVVVVIAVLAVITVVAYNSITGSATESSIKSDLSTAAKKMELYKAENGVYPAELGDADIAPQGYTIVRLSQSPTNYCLNLRKGGKSFSVNGNGGAVKLGSCAPMGIVSTVAGGEQGYADGPALEARFNSPGAVTVGPDGSIFVADTGNHRIRKIDSAGVVSTVAGSGVAGYLDGNAITARFNSPNGVAVAPNGTIYVTDRNNHRVRTISPSGQVTTLAGSGVMGDSDGQGVAAQFRSPRSPAVDSTGGVYIVSGYYGDENSIVYISPSGYANAVLRIGSHDSLNYFVEHNVTLSSNYSGTGVYFTGIDYGDDDVYEYVYRIGPTGVLDKIVSVPGVGSMPNSVVVRGDGRFVYGYSISTYDNETYRRMYVYSFGTGSSRSNSHNLAGGPEGYADGIGKDAQFEGFGSMFVGPEGLYIADVGNHKIRLIK